MINFLSSLCGFIALIGTYCIILSYSKKNEIAHTLSKGRVAEGTVIKMREDPYHSPTDMDYMGVAPVVEFRTINGLYQHFSTTYKKNSPYEVGQIVKIYYYHSKSRREMALEDDETGTLPQTLLKWGIILCLISYPFIIYKLPQLF